MALTAADIISEALKRGFVSQEDRSEEAVASLMFDLVPRQLEFLQDLSPLKAAYCTRQCGKTFTVARDLIITALEGPLRQCIYVNATYAEAKAIMWDDPRDGIPAILRRLEKDYNIVCRLNNTKMTAVFPNGSIVECLGADSDEGFDKLRGRKADLVVVDEAQKAKGLQDAVKSVIMFLLNARDGRLVLVGTPSEFCIGYFHDVTTQVADIQGWSIHSWGMQDVTTMPQLWINALRNKELLRQADDDPKWRREGLGQWVQSDAGHVLPVDQYSSLWDGTVPETIPNTAGIFVQRTQAITYIAGVDLGFINDPFGIVVIGWSREEGIIREYHSQTWHGIGTDLQFEKMAEVALMFPGLNRFFLDDGAQAKQIVADMRLRHGRNNPGIHLMSATKSNRIHMIEELRTDLQRGRTLVRRGSPLHKDLQVLSWDADKWERGDKEVAAGVGPDGRITKINHLFDAFRYVWRECPHYRAMNPVQPQTPEMVAAREERQHRQQMLKPRRLQTPGGRNGRYR